MDETDAVVREADDWLHMLQDGTYDIDDDYGDFDDHGDFNDEHNHDDHDYDDQYDAHDNPERKGDFPIQNKSHNTTCTPSPPPYPPTSTPTPTPTPALPSLAMTSLDFHRQDITLATATTTKPKSYLKRGLPPDHDSLHALLAFHFLKPVVSNTPGEQHIGGEEAQAPGMMQRETSGRFHVIDCEHHGDAYQDSKQREDAYQDSKQREDAYQDSKQREGEYQDNKQREGEYQDNKQHEDEGQCHHDAQHADLVDGYLHQHTDQHRDDPGDRRDGDDDDQRDGDDDDQRDDDDDNQPDDDDDDQRDDDDNDRRDNDDDGERQDEDRGAVAELVGEMLEMGK
eukprot:1008455-Amorphochlora_amoeboformis.AAC.3